MFSLVINVTETDTTFYRHQARALILEQISCQVINPNICRILYFGITSLETYRIYIQSDMSRTLRWYI